MCKDKLWDIKQLIENYPAFKFWGIKYLVKNRRIPIVRIGKRIYFRPERIEEWISEHEINRES